MLLASVDNARNAVDTIEVNCGSKGPCSQSFLEHHSNDGISTSLVLTRNPQMDTCAY